MNHLMTVSQIIRSASTIYISTTDGDSEKSTLLPIQLILDGKLYLGVSTGKPIYEQMLANPCVTIVTSKEGDLMHYSGTAVFEKEGKAARLIIDNNPSIKAIYNNAAGPKLAMFYLENATVRISDITGSKEVVTFDLD